jgi:hypothetical protein
MIEKTCQPSKNLAFVSIAMAALLAWTGPVVAGKGGDSADPLDLPPEVLAMRIKHLDATELESEANRWLTRLKETVRRLNAVKAEVWRENQALEAAEEQLNGQAGGAARGAHSDHRSVERGAR